MDTNQTTHYTTADGSSTLFSSRFGAHYHSLNGAVTESEHIFIGAGFNELSLKEINILEVGFGTGLNSALTASRSNLKGILVNYSALDLFPLPQNVYELLNYGMVLPAKTADYWRRICDAPWNQNVELFSSFAIRKLNVDFTTWKPDKKFHLVYFDAFAPNDQPEMWQEQQFLKLFNAMYPDGILVTYCVKGIVKKALTNAGFAIERLSGPPGKRHMLRARKK